MCPATKPFTTPNTKAAGAKLADKWNAAPSRPGDEATRRATQNLLADMCKGRQHTMTYLAEPLAGRRCPAEYA
ncbi:MAG: hypothetical protein IPP41_11980 [Rhodocyclaceae bacterium]|nr:hypothetical protein [Rhodocyclaceae bacterium]